MTTTPDLGLKKIGVYSLAVIPTAFVGYFRMRALKHFPTDILLGSVVGAATGILVPHFHKHRKDKKLETSAFFIGGGGGIYLKYYLSR